MASPPNPATSLWPKAMATVTSCTYTAGAGRAMAFGIPTSRHFLIAFNYFVEGELYTGQFSSPKAIPQSSLFPVAYNPQAPHQNDRSDLSAAGTRTPLLLIGILGSVALSLAWLALLRGCH